MSLPHVHASNAAAASALPSGLVAVFSGATAGIGRYSLEAFWSATTAPRVYIIGRSQSSADEVIASLRKLKPENFDNGGKAEFVQADLSLIQNVDRVCAELAAEEQHINLLFLSQGGLYRGETADGLPLMSGTLVYGRLRMIENLLPSLERAPGLRRVVSVAAGTKEGPVTVEDVPARSIPFAQARGHMTTVITLAHEQLKRKAPTVSFIHDFPGLVDTNFLKRPGALMSVLNLVSRPIFWLGFGVVTPAECGQRHCYLATSAAFPPAEGDAAAAGVPLADGVQVAVGTDGKPGSGCYTITEKCTAGDAKVLAVLQAEREKGTPSKLEQHFQDEFARITGNGAAAS